METNSAAAEEGLSDIDPAFHDICKQYGREMFALVHAAGMAQQALRVIAQYAEKYQARHLAHAAGVMGQGFNVVATELAKAKGWTEEVMVQCERDIERAFAAKIVVAGGNVLELPPTREQ